MHTTKRIKPTPRSVLLHWICALLLGVAVLAGCAAGEKSLAGREDLTRDLTECLPTPPTGWMAEPLDIDERITNLVLGKIDANREYAEIEGKGKVDVNIRTSAWCCWVVNYSGDLVKLEIQGRKAGLDPKKNKAVLYVALTHKVAVIFEAQNLPNAVEAVKYFASKTDLDRLKETLKKHKKKEMKDIL